MSTKQRILFICMGNICRSPLAEGIFLHLLKERGLQDRFKIESAGTGGWHAGELPDPRMREAASRNGISLISRARQVRREDFERFDLLICMDEDNREHILSMGAPLEKVRLLLDCDPSCDLCEVPDPYHGGPEGFDMIYRLVHSACGALLDELTAGQSVSK